MAIVTAVATSTDRQRLHRVLPELERQARLASMAIATTTARVPLDQPSRWPAVTPMTSQKGGGRKHRLERVQDEFGDAGPWCRPSGRTG